MGQGPLPIETRRQVYAFVLSLYETFEALPERGILVQDIESASNRILGYVAKYALAESKSKNLKDIVGEIKGLRALLGIVRDTSVLERYKARITLEACSKLEELFLSLLSEAAVDEKEAESPPALNMPYDTMRVMIQASPQLPMKTEDAGRPRSEADPTASSPAVMPSQPSDDRYLSARQEAIMEVLRHRPRVSVGDLANLFMSRVSRKTLQRDLQELIEKNIVKKEGDRRWTHYFV
ncbi:MAG: DeoR family transcriptional regulator [Candidatus Sungbacteria bacterium]|uniref:DeoR family transcriptional regulator n=1 Tax=Candidatus Sungiibacteriota bacterium TaxID=2750080 RepID=A0A9D6QTI0_9BACT|nr:DeoR family transcriptional regulator [Candidatus Sungbacteria bacterium]